VFSVHMYIGASVFLQGSNCKASVRVACMCPVCVCLCVCLAARQAGVLPVFVRCVHM